MDTLILYLIAATCLAWSFEKPAKTRMAMKKAPFENILPQFLLVLILVAMALAVLDTDTISLVLGKNSGFWGVLAASLVGAVTLGPGFVAFPAAAALMQGGAGATQIVAFVSSLMMCRRRRGNGSTPGRKIWSSLSRILAEVRLLSYLRRQIDKSRAPGEWIRQGHCRSQAF